MDNVEWITLAKAIATLSPHYGEMGAKKLILQRTRDGLLKRRIARLKTEDFKTCSPDFENFARQLSDKCELEPIFDAGGYVWEYKGDFETKETENGDHWIVGSQNFAQVQKSWYTTQNKRVVNQTYADWEISEFKHACLTWPELGNIEYYSIRKIHAIGIEVEAEFVERLVPTNLAIKTVNNPPNRMTKYDWGAAMSHLIAMAEIDGFVSDPHAHGVQAFVEKTMADWFDVNANQQPSEAMIRTYAAKVIQAMKAYRSKG
jgi:hypothetical protein